MPISRRVDQFFEDMLKLHLALTFDDVRLKTGHSNGIPPDNALSSWFSRHVPVHVPIISAAMDKVTEHKLAIAMALFGGLGIIHRSGTPEWQAKEVRRVKFHLNGMIDRPVCLFADQTVASALKLIDERKFSFQSFPVIDRDTDHLVGIMTSTDFGFCADHPEQLISTAMTTDLVAAPLGTTIANAYTIMQQRKIKMLPVVNHDNTIAGLYTWVDTARIQRGNDPLANIDDHGQLRVGAAIGILPDAADRVAALVDANVDVVVIDTAHADSKTVFDTLAWIEQHYPNLDVVVGNISQPESAQALIAAGADGIKIGQGPGSICTTRIIAGIGRPQVTAVYWCAREARDTAKVPVCADGGIRHSGDIPIALGAGADSVMLGNLLAGTDEAPGEIIFFEGRQWKAYRGMGSLEAMAASRASRERYGQTNVPTEKLIAEGISGIVPYRGSVASVLTQYFGGLKDGLGYVGAESIADLHAKADFDRLSNSGKEESHPHSIRITSDAPNYRRGE